MLCGINAWGYGTSRCQYTRPAQIVNEGHRSCEARGRASDQAAVAGGAMSAIAANRAARLAAQDAWVGRSHSLDQRTVGPFFREGGAGWV